jgi:hypothetical protein
MPWLAEQGCGFKQAPRCVTQAALNMSTFLHDAEGAAESVSL